MTDVSDARLLEQFARNGSEDAFAALVQRHIALVHSVALRHTANAQHAQDITQAVFVILARKVGALGRKTVLPGWLYHTARLTAANFQRAETRRVRREQEAFMQSKLEESPTDNLWRELSPQLDEAMAGLGTAERDALVLRYFQNKSMAEVGQSLGLAENTAQKRVSRALDKLRKFFTKRGVDSTAAGIAENISAHSVQAVPVALAKSVTAAALAKGATASTSTLTLIKGALKIMAWTKAKTITAAGIGLLLITTMTGTFVMLRSGNPPREPTYQNKSLRQWIVAQPTSPRVITGDDIVTYRRTALLAMGKPAIRYLCWMIAHPQQTLENSPSSQPDRPSFMSVVAALGDFGPGASAAAPDLVRLWEREDSNGNALSANYNGFPLALAELGDASPEILDALHRHFNSPWRLHGDLCAFAAWQLNPNDSDATSFLRHELVGSDSDDATRYVLLDTFCRYTTNSTPFLPEIRSLIAVSTNARPEWQVLAANAAWHILHKTDAANVLMRHLAAEARKTNATVGDVNQFAAAALALSKVPGVVEFSMPILRELGRYKDASAASFATNILDRLKTIAQGKVAPVP